MTDGIDERQIGELFEAVRKLAVAGERVADSLAKLETLYIDMLRKQDEDRAEAKERQKKIDVDSEEFKQSQKKWDERSKKWEEQELQKNSWLLPRELGFLLFTVALAATAITVGILATR